MKIYVQKGKKKRQKRERERYNYEKKTNEEESSKHALLKKDYKDSLRKLQVELVKLQRHFIKCDDKILIILEGRHAAGKDGTIKRIV